MNQTKSSNQVLRQILRENQYIDEALLLEQLIEEADLSETQRSQISEAAESLVNAVRDSSDPLLMESFLAEYGLSTDEGVALMCLAEALLRVPDNETVDALIHDKISPANWGKHLGQSSSSLVNASTWALMLTGTLIADEPEGIVGTLRGAVRRLGEPVVRTAVNQAIRELGNQFVLGENINAAIENSEDAVNKGFTYSYDMLGEAAMTDADAKRYHLAYSEAVASLGKHCHYDTVAENPGISVKLSALYPRYEYRQREQVMVELVSRTRSLAMLAKSANMGFNIDAEEADRLDLSLDVIEEVLSAPGLAGWDGFGIVVQAYSKRASFVIDWLYDMAQRLDRRIMVRLVKGAYWDTEVKRAQVSGFDDYPVFTRKEHTDVAYICCAKKLLGMVDRIYPQFATHNAHTVAAVHQLAGNVSRGNHDIFEFQRLHGMGDTLHRLVHEKHQTRCRIYAPVGAHEDLLAYLVRRLLENGANSSFVNQLVDESISPEEIARDPFTVVQNSLHALTQSDPNETGLMHPGIPLPASLYGNERVNSRGFDINDPLALESLRETRATFNDKQWYAAPMQPGYRESAVPAPTDCRLIKNPATGETVGFCDDADGTIADAAFQYAQDGINAWQSTHVDDRAACLLRIADLYESHTAELVELTCREAGKTLDDSIAEIREAVDFLRYYAVQAQALLFDATAQQAQPYGTFVCISPWNFPLAIFTGQIAAALVTGNCVIAKPAEQTPLIASRAVALMHEAGIPEAALQLLPGAGSILGAALVAHQAVAGVCFTGSTRTAQIINQKLAENPKAELPFIAETGGINAMIVDSTALPEQAVRDIVDSAFRSAGQRCSALRLLCVQSDIKDKIVTMLKGAMDLLVVDDPGLLKSDLGPVIDRDAQTSIINYCNTLTQRGQLLHQSSLAADAPDQGHFVLPSLYHVKSIAEVDEEVFGPVLHIYSFDSNEINSVVDQINAKGYGLTFGLHTRVDERVQEISDRINVGNLYINRNQIGAVVGTQPFGGHGLSGTGPKAGGPHYLLRFLSWETNTDTGSTEIPANKTATTVTPDNQPEQSAGINTLTQAFDDIHKQRAGHRLERTAMLAQLEAENTFLTTPTSISTALNDHQRFFAQLLENEALINNIPSLTKPEFSQRILRLGAMLDTHFHITIDLPGPTGESNRLSMEPAGTFLVVLEDNAEECVLFLLALLSAGNGAVVAGANAELICSSLVDAVKNTLQSHVGDTNLSLTLPSLIAIESAVNPDSVKSINHLSGLCVSPLNASIHAFRKTLARRDGPIVPLLTSAFDICPMIHENTLCIDTTAAGGNAKLLANAI